jgi:glycosyltransferase involved in cell wall biosynthesis
MANRKRLEKLLIVGRGMGGVESYRKSLSQALEFAGIETFSLPDMPQLLRSPSVGLQAAVDAFRSVFPRPEAILCMHYAAMGTARAIARIFRSRLGVVVHGFADREAVLTGRREIDVVNGEIANAFQMSDFAFFVSKELKEYYSQMVPSSCTSYVIMPCVDTAIFRPVAGKATKSKKLRFLTVTNMNPGAKLNGLRFLLSAICSFDRKEECTFYVAGGGSQLPLIEKEVRDNGLSGCVRLLGQVERLQLSQLYNSVDAFVQTVEWCGFDLALLEAMACAIPAIVTKKYDYELMFKQYSDILMVDFEIHSVIDALDFFFANPDKIRRIGERGMSCVQSNFSIESRAKQLLEIFDASV